MKKAISIALAAVLVGAAVGGVGYKSKGFTDWSRETWLGTEATETDKISDESEAEKQSPENIVAVDENGQPVYNGSVLPARMSFLRSSAESVSDENGISTYSAAAVQVTASITPADALYKSAEWSLRWESDTIASDLSEYIKLTVDSDTPLTASVECVKDFNCQIVLVFTVVSSYDQEFTAECTLDYLSYPTYVEAISMRRSYSGVYPNKSNDFYINGRGQAVTPIDIYSPRGDVIQNNVDGFKFIWSNGSVRADLSSVMTELVESVYYICFIGGSEGWTSYDVNQLQLYDYVYSHMGFSASVALSSYNNELPIRVVYRLSSGYTLSVDFKCNFVKPVQSVSLSTTDYVFA